ncbi:DUF5309 domain-containing protein [bacterium]|nr:DUF5309 domain-containing protein [bacterium]
MAAKNFVTTGTLSEKEDLANFISMVTRDETPFMASIGKTKAKAIYHEWQTDELLAPGSNAVAEGSTFSTVAGNQSEGGDRTRLGNYTQINSKTVQVSGTKRSVDQAGVADEYAYQLKKVGTEMRRDLELDLVHSFNDKNGSGTRTMGGYQAYVNDNVVNAGAAGAYTAPSSTGDGTAGAINRGASDANLDAIELSDVDDIMQTIYEQGGKATTLMTSPKNKRELSSKAHGTAQNTVRNLDDSGKIRQSIELFDSDFGSIQIVPNYIMGLDFNTGSGATTNSKDFTALVYDPAFFKIATLRPLQETEVGQQGDSTIGQIVEECTLAVSSPKSAGMIVGLGGA